MSNAKVIYNLSEKGRKQSLLSGGDGKMEQVLYTEVTKEILDLPSTEVTKDGEVIVSFNSNFVTDMEIKYTNNYTGIGKPYIKEVIEDVSFDNIQTVDSLISWYKDINKKIEKLNLEMDKELEIEFEKYNKSLEEYELDKEIKRLADQKAKEEREEKKEAEKKRQEKEDFNWIEQFGSEHLKDTINLGYKYKKTYVVERVKMELPGFEIDFGDDADWNERVSPSKKAIDEVKKYLDKDYNAEIIWLTRPISFDDYDYYNQFEACEAIWINFRGYNLLKLV